MSHFQIRLPATSANLGPGFDTMALALELFLEIKADPAATYSIHATGRNIEICTRLQRNLMLAVYEDTLRAAGKPPHPLALTLINAIPIGMGCGSSAAARLAGIALANHFGELGWNSEKLLQEACRLEGHPDNAAACWLGGFTVAAGSGEVMRTISIDAPRDWTAILVIPDRPLATSAARAILPASYARADAVFNVQNAALLTAAFHAGRSDLLQLAMTDRLHQPYRSQICPLLPILLPLAGNAGILGVALSGAGPAVLALVLKPEVHRALDLILDALTGSQPAEVLHVPLCPSDFPRFLKITEV
jgi:homoserine kinase